jgi:BUD22
MPKRKREEPLSNVNNDEEDDRALKIRKSRLVAQKEQGTILLYRALKVARGFERQKLGRRQKGAKENPQELLRLKEEVIVLKQLDLAKTAENYLFKQLVRTKRIREAPAFVSLYGEDGEMKVEGMKVGAEANVVARLINSNPVRDILPGIMAKMYRCLGLEEFLSTTNTKFGNKGSKTGGSDVTGPGHGVDKNVINSPQEGDSSSGKDDQADASMDLSDDESMAAVDDASTANSDTENSDVNDDMAQYKHRLAPSSCSEDESDAEEDGACGRWSIQTSGRRQKNEVLSLSLSPSLKPSRSASPPPQPTHKSTSTKPQPQTAHTTILPSLTLGGYFSGSESNSGSEFDLELNLPGSNQNRTSKGDLGPALPQPRKNRRGQRARQQIAENKYGSSAKHLRKQQQQAHGQAQAKPSTGRDRDAGWDVRKGATENGSSTAGIKGRGKWGHDRISTRGRMGATGANSEAVALTSKKKRSQRDDATETRPIHPSWEAARKRKLQNQKVTSLFQGKKISFD